MLVLRARRWCGVDCMPAELPVCSAVSGRGGPHSPLGLLSHGDLDLGKRKWGSVETECDPPLFPPAASPGLLGPESLISSSVYKLPKSRNRWGQGPGCGRGGRGQRARKCPGSSRPRGEHHLWPGWGRCDMGWRTRRLVFYTPRRGSGAGKGHRS